MQALQTLKTKIYHTAIYLRLSKDDGEKYQNSSSIINQKSLLKDFTLQNNWEIYDYYIDDGYSGTNFNRPDFKRLLSDIEKGLVNCVVVKDLSRLGRNYLEVGHYTEQYFPTKGVRFIALNDNYDTIIDDNDFAPFKNIMNEWYAKDVSKKIKSVFAVKKQEGTLFMTPPYGYRLDKEKGRVVDEEVSYIIRWIFEQFIKGLKIAQIAQALSDKQVLAPGYYTYATQNLYAQRFQNMTKKQATTWKTQSVNRILNNIEYTGVLVCNKTVKQNYKNKKIIPIQKNDWIIHENKFEPIINKELFDKAQELYNGIRKTKLPLSVNKYKGLIYCNHCGEPFRFKTDHGKSGYLCKTKDCACNFIEINALDTILINELLLLKEIILKNEKRIIDDIHLYESKTNTSIHDDKFKKIEELQQNKNKVISNINKAFEAYIGEELPASAYQSLLKKYKNELANIDGKLEIINALQENKKFNDTKALEFINDIKQISNEQKITRTLLTLFLDKILISSGKKIRKNSYERIINLVYPIPNDILKEFIEHE